MILRMVAGDEFTIDFFEFSSLRSDYKYVVIVARFNSSLIWVRQKGRETWEIPAGHVETNESPEQAAQRELREETGAVSFSLHPLCDFSIRTGNSSSYNRLFFAEINELGKLGDFEIEEVRMLNVIPEKLTYGRIQPALIDEARKYVKDL